MQICVCHREGTGTWQTETPRQQRSAHGHLREPASTHAQRNYEAGMPRSRRQMCLGQGHPPTQAGV